MTQTCSRALHSNEFIAAREESSAAGWGSQSCLQPAFEPALARTQKRGRAARASNLFSEEAPARAFEAVFGCGANALPVTESRLKRPLQPGMAAPRWLIFLCFACLPIVAAPLKNVVVYKEPGRFGAWP